MATAKQQKTKRKPISRKRQSMLSRIDMRAIISAFLVLSFLFFTLGVLFYVVFFAR